MRSIEAMLLVGLLTGCATPTTILQGEGPTMRELIENGRRTDTPESVRRGHALSTESWQRNERDRYTRDATNEIDQLFPRLVNPEIAIYVYPHLATGRRMPVPGYTTALPLYDRYEYALPGEHRE